MEKGRVVGHIGIGQISAQSVRERLLI